MEGPASQLFAQAVNGRDFLQFSHEHIAHELRLTPFVARKVMAMRDNYLLRVPL